MSYEVILQVIQDSKSLLGTYPVASGGMDGGTGRHIKGENTRLFRTDHLAGREPRVARGSQRELNLTLCQGDRLRPERKGSHNEWGLQRKP